MDQKTISKGAEATITFQDNSILKFRAPKSYRHHTLDTQIRTRRTKGEAKLLAKAKDAGARVPCLFRQGKTDLHLEYLQGDALSFALNTYTLQKQKKILQELGCQIALLHDANIIHGDLTTSNMILHKGAVFLIDFGLGYISTKIEDKAVDIHLLKQALQAKHFHHHEELFSAFLTGYTTKEKERILERLTAVEKRGRYRH